MKIAICGISFPAGVSPEEQLKIAADAGYDAIEPPFSAEGPVSLQSTEDDLTTYRKAAEKAGLEIASVTGGLYWGTPFTSDDADVRAKALDIARAHIRAAKVLGAETVLVVPGVVHAFFIENCPVVRYDVVYERSLAAMKALAPLAEELDVHVGVENVWNKFLLSPMEMARFVDEVGSTHVGCYFDVGNVVAFGYPQHWITILGSRIRKVHVKDFKAEASVMSMAGFVDILQGDVDWPAVIAALEDIGYDGPLTAEMIPTYTHHPIQRIYNTAASLRALLRRGEEAGR